MTIPRCALCNWPLDDEHGFNLDCAVASAENDQILAEVEDARRLFDISSDEEKTEFERRYVVSMEIIRDLIAYKVFERMVSRQP